MTTVAISIVAGVLTFCMGMLGLYTRRLLPERHMSTGSKEMIGAIIGLVSLLLARARNACRLGVRVLRNPKGQYRNALGPIDGTESNLPSVWSGDAAITRSAQSVDDGRRQRDLAQWHDLSAAVRRPRLHV
jgi:hypothetical protein